MKRTGIKRGEPLKRKQWMHKRTRKSGEEKRCRDGLAKRSGGACEIRVPGVCIGRATVCSHRKRRSQSTKDELWSLDNTMAGCLQCELHLTAYGSDPHVRAHGWTVHPSDDPAQIPITRCIGAGCDRRASKAVA